MSIVLVGANHKSASVEVREQLSAAITAKGFSLSKEIFAGWVFLSTCNRIELYASLDEINPNAAEKLEGLLRKISGLDAATCRTAMYHKWDGAVVEHLFRVASSLDSLVLGENEILGQIKQSFHSADTDDVLNRLFQQALHTGKRVRTETQISKHPVSVASVAVSFVKQVLGRLDQRHALLIGAGEMGTQVAQRLCDRQIKKLSIMSLRGERARNLATQLDGVVVEFSDLDDALRDADVVVTATGATEPVINHFQIQRVIKHRKTPLMLLDLGMPRDIDPQATMLPDVSLFNIDHLQVTVAMHQQKREQEIPQVEQILENEMKKFSHWMQYQRTYKVLHVS